MSQTRDIAIDIVPIGAAADEATQAALREPAGKTASESRTNLFDFRRAALENLFEEELAEKRFRAHQVMKWIHHRYVTDFAEMTDLGKVMRAKLEERAVVHAPQ